MPAPRDHAKSNMRWVLVGYFLLNCHISIATENVIIISHYIGYPKQQWRMKAVANSNVSWHVGAR